MFRPPRIAFSVAQPGRVVGHFGYRAHEVPLAPPIRMDASAKLFETPGGKIYRQRRPVKACIGFRIPGISRPQCDPDDPATLADGAVKRFLNKPISDVEGKLDGLRKFAQTWCERNLEQLPSDTDVSFDSWIEKSPYPRWRKRQLAEAWNKCDRQFRSSHKRVSSFIKNEGYDTWKHARWINSRSDEFKCFVGPWISAVSKPIFALPEFIKTVPVADRPQFIIDKLYQEGCKYIATDYTAFEAHFTPYIMRCLEFVAYRWVLARVPGGLEFLQIFEKVVCGRNNCRNKNLRMGVDGKRMSGECTTSVGNGISNLLILAYLGHTHGFTFKCVVEGDDALAVITDGQPPTSEMYRELGFDIKLEQFDDMCEASFCGLVFDIDSKCVLADPRKHLAEASVGDPKYLCVRDNKRTELLRAKGYSYVYCYKGCPVIQSMGLALLRATRDADISGMLESRFHYRGVWQQELLRLALESDLPVQEVSMGSRLLMEKKFNLSVAAQLLLETYFDSLHTLDQIQVLTDFPEIPGLFPPEWHQYDEIYHITQGKTQTPSDSFIPFPRRDFSPELWEKKYKTTD